MNARPLAAFVRSREHGRRERLLAAIPPAELRAPDVTEEEQLNLTLALLDRAAERAEAAPA